MTWKPSEGLLRASEVVDRIEDALAAPMAHGSVLRFRMVELIAHAVDQALTDQRVTLLKSAAETARELVRVREAAEAELSTMPPTADPHGFGPIPESNYTHLDIAIANAAREQADGSVIVDLPTPAVAPPAPAEPEKRGRGRPKGSKTKKKAVPPKKAAKAKKANGAVEQTPRPEAVDTPPVPPSDGDSPAPEMQP